MDEQIRWKQRLSQYKLALSNLREAVNLHKVRELTKLEEQGFIKAFELVHELAWLVIKDFYKAQGETSIQGSRDAFRLAFQRGLIQNGDTFMKSIKSRQLTVYTYNESTADQIHDDILNLYFKEFEALELKLIDVASKED